MSPRTRLNISGQRSRTNILDFLTRFCLENGIPPTLREIADGAQISSISTVKFHLDGLIDDGWIEDRGGKRASRRYVPKHLRYRP